MSSKVPKFLRSEIWVAKSGEAYGLLNAVNSSEVAPLNTLSRYHYLLRLHVGGGDNRRTHLFKTSKGNSDVSPFD